MLRREINSTAIAIALLVSIALAPKASAATCKAGFVPRAAAGADTVCVTPASQARVAAENARAPLLWLSGPFGLKTCAQGFVWREAFIGDLICVTPLIRTAVRQENDTAADRQQ
jgi:hypothetical protein